MEDTDMSDKQDQSNELGVTDWILIDQNLINRFADVTSDQQYIHVDIERAAQSPFGTTIAHGLLSLSLLPYFISQITLVPEGIGLMVNYGFDKIRFISPVPSGSELRAHFVRLKSTERKPGQELISLEVTVEIRGQNKPALVAEWLVLTEKKK